MNAEQKELMILAALMAASAICRRNMWLAWAERWVNGERNIDEAKEALKLVSPKSIYDEIPTADYAARFATRAAIIFEEDRDDFSVSRIKRAFDCATSAVQEIENKKYDDEKEKRTSEIANGYYYE